MTHVHPACYTSRFVRVIYSSCIVLIGCGEEEVVRGVHSLSAGVVQVYHRLHVVEEEEKGRKVEQEVEREDQGEETAHVNMNMEMG